MSLLARKANVGRGGAVQSRYERPDRAPHRPLDAPRIGPRLPRALRAAEAAGDRRTSPGEPLVQRPDDKGKKRFAPGWPCTKSRPARLIAYYDDPADPRLVMVDALGPIDSVTRKLVAVSAATATNGGPPDDPPSSRRARSRSCARSGKITAKTLVRLIEAAKPGVTTRDLDRIADESIRALGGIPTFIGYNGYPSAICTSVNDEVVHGMPGPRILLDGDLLSIDIGTTLEGYVSDSAVTVAIGRASETGTAARCE